MRDAEEGGTGELKIKMKEMCNKLKSTPASVVSHTRLTTKEDNRTYAGEI